MDLIQKTKREIQDLEKVQGASEVAVAVLRALKKYGQELAARDKKTFIKKLRYASKILLSARPTESLAQNGVRFVFINLRGAKDVSQLKRKLKVSINQFLKIVDGSREEVSTRAARIIRKGDNVFTHCHSSTVEEALIRAKESGKRFKVFNTETRPLFQGHITAKNLLKAGIPVTMVVDSSSAFLISKHSGKKLMMDKIIIGCDAILSDGSIINKIGSFGMSVVALREKVPIYIVAPLLKFHPRSWIRIERRPSREVWKNAPQKLKIINFAFDLVPAHYITAIICEAGIIQPKEVRKFVKKLYPWLS